MPYTGDGIAPQTIEHHFTEPVKEKQTTYTTERYTHQVPLDWFLVVSDEIDVEDYEFYLDNGDIFDEVPENYSVDAVEFDYEKEPNSDGTGKPFHISFIDPEGEVRKCYPRTNYLLWLLDYDEATYEIVAVTTTDNRDGVLVTIQECLPHILKK